MNSRKSKRLVSLAILVLVLLSIGLGVWLYLTTLLSPVNPCKATPTTFTIEHGDSSKKIGDKLTASGLVHSQLAFRLAVYLEKVGGKIQAGEYALAPNMSARVIATTLTRGISDTSLTIPEGYRLEQIGEAAETKLGIKYSDFLSAAKGQEGYLFPDTYALSKTVTASELVSKLRSTWDAKVSSLPHTPTHDEVVLASILERETLTDAERPIVAGILKKRLDEGWALEVDATIQYMLGKKGEWWPVPLLGDRTIKSPFNTYLNKTLPPAPICNPGLVSLAAIESPTDSPYFFYLHDKSGNIHYAATNAEHESNIAKYIR